MKTCIICRTEKNESEFNDEHVIPDSINGYYHINTVCINCNSNIGSKIDSKLTNHQFITFQRYSQSIAGKSGQVPNPFSGTHTLKDDKDQKLRLELKGDGGFDIKLLPKVPQSITDNFNIIIDKKDEKKSDLIIDKFLKRHGISKEKVKIEKTHSSTEKPWVQASMKIDIKDFKMAILKIAYEFAVDTIPNYINDRKANEIAKLLENCDFDNLYSKINFLGDGFNNEILKPFSHLIDFENNNHYLILFDSHELGLIGMVNLFNVFNLGICLSEISGYIDETMIIGKNDIDKKTFEKFTLSQVISNIYSPISYRFQYFLPNKEILKEFMDNDNKQDSSFYTEGNNVPFFDRNGNIKYQNIDEKLNQPQLSKNGVGDDKEQLITQIDLDEELFIKLLPINKLFQVLSVSIEQYKLKKF